MKPAKAFTSGVVATLVVLILSAPGAAQDALSPEDAAPFMGAWTVSMDSPQGPVTMNVSLEAEDGRLVGRVSSSELGVTPVTSVTRSGEGIRLRFSSSYQGTPLNLSLTLFPDGERLRTTLDVNQGQFTFPGTATRG